MVSECIVFYTFHSLSVGSIFILKKRGKNHRLIIALDLCTPWQAGCFPCRGRCTLWQQMGCYSGVCRTCIRAPRLLSSPSASSGPSRLCWLFSWTLRWRHERTSRLKKKNFCVPGWILSRSVNILFVVWRQHKLWIMGPYSWRLAVVGKINYCETDSYSVVAWPLFMRAVHSWCAEPNGCKNTWDLGPGEFVFLIDARCAWMEQMLQLRRPIGKCFLARICLMSILIQFVWHICVLVKQQWEQISREGTRMTLVKRLFPNLCLQHLADSQKSPVCTILNTEQKERSLQTVSAPSSL